VNLEVQKHSQGKQLPKVFHGNHQQEGLIKVYAQALGITLANPPHLEAVNGPTDLVLDLI